MRCRELTRCANSDRTQRSKLCAYSITSSAPCQTGDVAARPRSAILDCNGAPLDPAEFVQSQAETWPPRANPIVGSLPVGCARAATEFFRSEFSHTQTVLLDSSMAWCWL